MKAVNKNYGLIFLCLILTLICGLVIFAPAQKTSVHAQTETLQEKIVRFTNSDLLDGQPIGGETIQDFAVKFKTGKYRPTASEPLKLTDVLSKTIPLELFYTEGTHVYMGQEYGYILTSYYNFAGTSFENRFLIIDFNILNYYDGYMNIIPNQIGYRIEPLVQAYVETGNDQGRGPWIITQPNSWVNFNFKIQNITLGANLSNENELNDGDNFYNFSQDKGDVLSFVQMPYKAFYDKEGSDDKIVDWLADLIMTKGLDTMALTGIPFLSTGAGIARKVYDYAKYGEEIFDAVIDLDIKPEKISTLGNGEFLGKDYLPKYGESGSQYAQGEFARNTYIKLKEGKAEGEKEDSDALKTVYLAPSMYANFDDNNKLIQDNGFIDFIVKTQGEVSNSRIAFGASFEVILDSVSDSVLVQNADNQYEFIFTENSEANAALVTHGAERKIFRKAPSTLPENDAAYLLDGKGYMLYKFQPKKGEKFSYGNYRFYTRYQTSQPGTRIHIFKTFGSNGSLAPATLANMTREELIAHPYLLAYNYKGSFDDMWQLDYEFSENFPDATNTYYILYTYSFDYLYGSSCFNACYEFLPPALTQGSACNFSLPSQKEKYFMFSPTSTANYIVQSNDFSNVKLTVYKEDTSNVIAERVGNNAEVLLLQGKKYLISVTNNGVSQNGSVKIVLGQAVNSNAFNYNDLKISESRFYKFIPTDFSGIYQVAGDVQSLVIEWYDSDFRLMESGASSLFLTKESTYYLKIFNSGVSDKSGSLQNKYQFEEAAFSSKVKIETDGHKQFWAYVIEASNIDNATITATLLMNGQTLRTNAAFTGNKFVFDLTEYIFNAENKYHFNAAVKVVKNTNQYEQVLKNIQINNPSALYNSSTTYSSEYTRIRFDKTIDYVNKVVSIPSSVKVLTIEALWEYYIRGLSINIASSSEPLMINIKNIDIYAPAAKPAITSQRNIILNCFGTVRFSGGGGIKDDFNNIYGEPAITMQSNSLVLNGSGNLLLDGGKGGDTSDGKDYYYSSTAGGGGTAVEVGDLVINLDSLTVRGGAGGNGGAGKKGSDGANGVGLQSNGVGATGGDGAYGGYACSGGTAGMGVRILGEKCVIYSTNLNIYGGVGGNGGRGGDGGRGGNGAKGKDGGLFGGQCGGGNGGRGGNGCYGGSYGRGMVAFNLYDIQKIINLSGQNHDAMLNRWASNGIGGAGGMGGQGGTGGEGGKNTWGVRAPAGTNGDNGFNGSPGGDPSPF